ncbi:hypothetical protein [Marinobacter shengliensis]|uniref:hypothetical protein n=1 Tax=Marinobacter shengliensis TaxID=1389223 RepID=UPI001107ACB0|nr:hypothetical protein [Marinobacter shengliensis]
MEAHEKETARPVMLTPSQIATLQSLVQGHTGAIKQSLSEPGELADSRAGHRALAKLSYLSAALDAPGLPDTAAPAAPLSFSAQEVASIQRFTMHGMALVEKALTGSENALALIARGPTDLDSMRQDVNSFRATFGKLTLAAMVNSGATEVTTHPPCC